MESGSICCIRRKNSAVWLAWMNQDVSFVGGMSTCPLFINMAECILFPWWWCSGRSEILFQTLLTSIFYINIIIHNKKSCFKNHTFSLFNLILLLNKLGPEHHEISIFHLNISCIRDKLQYIETIASGCDILCITENILDERVTRYDLILSGCTVPSC